MPIHMMLLMATTAQAEEKAKEGVEVTGEARLIGSLPPDFVVDVDGNQTGQGFVLDSRLRPRIDYRRGGWTFAVEGDLFTGQVAGDTWDLEGESHRLHPESIGVMDAGNFKLRRTSLRGRVGPVMVTAGLQTMHWGMGLVANDGAHQPFFGRSDYGDRQIRLRLGTKPVESLPLFVSVAGDVVVEDDMAIWTEGQRAYQGIGSVLYKPGDHKIGALFAYRDQTEADGVRKTQGFIADVHTNLVFPLGAAGHKLVFEAEGAHLRGNTSRFSNVYNPEGLKLETYGVVSRLSASMPDDLAQLHLHGGWSSGDGDPDDDTLNDYSFDRDYGVGMLLFDQHQSAIEVALYNQLTDPGNSGQPPDGVDALVSEGSARRVTFVQPIIEAKALPWLSLKTGVLLAWSTGPVSQGFSTYRNGGVPVNHLGEPTSGYKLGTEIDWGLSVDGESFNTGPVHPIVDVQGAHLLPSENLGGGDALSLIMLRTRFLW
jgi:hypothetical protein